MLNNAQQNPQPLIYSGQTRSKSQSVVAVTVLAAASDNNGIWGNKTKSTGTVIQVSLESFSVSCSFRAFGDVQCTLYFWQFAETKWNNTSQIFKHTQQ